MSLQFIVDDGNRFARDYVIGISTKALIWDS